MKKYDRDLKVRTKDFALQIIRLAGRLPRSPEASVIGRQVLRSGTSIGANYREAHRSRRKAEFIAKCGDSLKELDETDYWLELLLEAGIASPEATMAARSECDELIAIFVTILKHAKASVPTS